MRDGRDHEREYYNAILSVRRRFGGLGDDILKTIVDAIDPRDFIIPELEVPPVNMKNEIDDDRYLGYLLFQFIDPPGLTWDQVRIMLHVFTSAELIDYMMFDHIDSMVDIEQASMATIENQMYSIIDDRTSLADYVYSIVCKRAHDDPGNVYFDLSQFLLILEYRAFKEYGATHDEYRAQTERHRDIVRGFLYALRHNQLVTMRGMSRRFRSSMIHYPR